ncbi:MULTISPECIES: type 1 glutamine amidotransferase domain-containing protein [unclassified Micromonospora]|uniref:type 1 glutamine amidotransferase domain-containing protein n=1 Tax=Micromonospora TaxID=1873 RepID=UPI001E369A11|nr:MULTISPECIES: type 1 glutamine amidotransferase domain-containing protein [unclassified Micromonospora]MCZ7477946.1 type 1 glutamine amidotransferase domain-containing protein [Micromonospora sp. WMMC273]WBC02653.1 type 1 glutamine amidotransferase domain-containing protein [Micromonospora sp. WMMA1976]
MTRALIALTSHSELGRTGRSTGYYVGEAAEPWEVFRAAGYDVDLVSVAGGEPPVDGRDENDSTQNDFLATAGVTDTPKAADVDPAGYDVILFAGGHGTMWDFPDDPDLARIARSVYERGGVVAAVCHGPSALVNLTLTDGSRLIAGKRVAGFTNSEEAAVGLTDEVPFLLADKLGEAGAQHVPAPDFTEHVVVDGRLVTGQNPQSARAVADAVVKLIA